MDNLNANEDELDSNIPEKLRKEIKERTKGNAHYTEVYRVAKWGIIEEKVFLSTYGELLADILPNDPEKYPMDEIGTYSTSVYTGREPCDKYISCLKRSKRLKKTYLYPVVIKGKTSKGCVELTVNRDKEADPEHIDWWIYDGKRSNVMQDFIIAPQNQE